MADISLNEVVDLLSELFTNMNNLDKTYYNMFYNTEPMDIIIERYDENGVLRKYVVPNRAKDKDNVITGHGTPEGVVPATIGKLYIDLDSNYLYYKTEGSTTSPTSSGWLLILTTANSSDIYQERNEKGQPNGYAGLDSDGIVVRSQLPPESLSYFETGESIIITIILKTVLDVVSSNPNLVIENNYTETMEEVGVIVKVLTEDTLANYTLNTDVATKTGSIYINNEGIGSGFSSDNYITTNLYGTELVFKTGDVNIDTETLCNVAGNITSIIPSATTLTVTSSNPDLIIINNYDGRKDIGTETVLLTYRDILIWNDNNSTIQGNLDTSTIDVSGFTSSAYLVPSIPYTSSNPLIIAFRTGSDVTTGQAIIGANMSVSIKNGYLGYNSLEDQEFSPVYSISPDTQYYLKIVYDSANLTSLVQYSVDGVVWTSMVPSELGGLFILNSYAIGKGNLDGAVNVPFLGTITSTETGIEYDNTLSPFANILYGWYLGDMAVQLSAYDLVIDSGEPQEGDTLTLVYNTGLPKIGTEEVTLNTTYKFRYNNTSTYTYVPQLYKDNIWVDIGDAITTDVNILDFTKGEFNGTFDLLNTTTSISTLNTTKQYTDVGTLDYNLTVVDGFSDTNYISMNTPTVDGDFILNIITGNDTLVTQTLVENNYNNLQTALIIDSGQLYYVIDGMSYLTDYSTITADTEYSLKFSRSGGAWVASCSTDNSTWVPITANNSTSFDDLFKDSTLIIGRGFNGSVDVGSSTVTTTNGIKPLFLQEHVVTDSDVPLLIAGVTYRWYDEGGTEVDLADYGLSIISGVPNTGDTLTLTFTTTEDSYSI